MGDGGLGGDEAPELHAVGKVVVFGGRLLVFAVRGFEEAFGPGVA